MLFTIIAVEARLEGEEDTVSDLVQVIRKDTRHAGFKVLGSKQIK